MLLTTSPRPLSLWLEGLTDNALALWAVSAVVEPLVIIVMVLIVAMIVLKVVRRAIRRVIERAKQPVTIGLHGLPGRLASFGGTTLDVEAAEEQREHALRRAQRADALGTLAESVVRVVVWGFAILTALGTVGVNLAPLIAGAGVLGVAIGFGAQDTVKDFLSGVIMLVEDQYGVGDVIDAGPASGVVEEVTLRTTRLRDINGVVWHIPNGSITRVGNMTQEWSRLVLDVDVAYETDLDHAIEVLRGLLGRFSADEEIASWLLDMPEVVGVHALADSSVVIRVMAKTVPGKQWEMGRRLRLAVKREFDTSGIEIPFPQRTVWHRGLDSGTDPLPAGPSDD
jgi:small-conductance mechanosensitive channel